MPAILPAWAATGNIVPPDPSKISVGWLLGEKPPHEYMNWWQNLATQRVNHILTRGIPEWDSSISYATGALAKGASGLVYRALVSSTNQNPASSPGAWVQVTENASSLSSGVVPNARLTGEYTGFTNIAASGTITAGQFVGNGTGLSGLNASALGSGIVPNARIEGAYTGFTNITASGAVTAATFAGNGAALTSLNASQLATGTVADARLPSTMSGKAFTSGISFGSTAVASITDLSKHLALYGDNYGINVTSSRLNLNAGGGQVQFVIGGSGVAQVSSAGFIGPAAGLTGLNASALASGTVPNARISGSYNNFTTIGVSGRVTAGDIFTTSGGVGIASGSGGIFYLNDVDGYFRGPSSSGRPIYTYKGDEDTGWGRSGNNTLSAWAGGTEQLRITSNVTLMNGGTFQGSGSGLTSLNASQLASGTVPTARLPADGAAHSWVGARYSDMAHNGIGMIAYATDMVRRATGYGSARPASDLRLANGESAGGGPTLAGTSWRCLFYSQDDSDGDRRTGPWQRIS